MFNKNLERRMTLVSDNAESCFPNISASQFMGDYSFLATLRALLIERSPEAHVRFRYVRSNHDASTLRGASHHAVIGVVQGRDADTDTIKLHNIDGPDGSAAVMFERFDHTVEGFVATHRGWREMQDLQAYVAPVMNARFYINEANHATLILVEKLNLRKYHYLQSVIPRYIPWLFADNPVTDEERSLLHSLTERISARYEQLIEQFAQKIDFRTMAIKRIMGGFEKRAAEGRVRRAQEEESNIRRNIRDNLNQYSSLINNLDKCVARLAGLREQLENAGDDSELVDFFTRNKMLIPLSSDGMSFSFIVNTYLESFDPDMYRTMSQRPQSHIFNGYEFPDVFSSIESRKKLFDAIFSDEPLLKIKVCAYYWMDSRGEVESASGYNYPPECNDRIPNPHLQYHNCLGNHSRYIRDALLEGNLIGAIGQCISSAKSINIGEGITVTRFFRDLLRNRGRIIELPDKTCVNALEALRWLEAQEANEQEEKEEASENV